MKRFFVLGGWVLLCVFSSCSREVVVELLDDEVQFSANVIEKPETRISVEGDGRGVFDDGDRIRVCITPDDDLPAINRVLTLEEGVWKPSVLWDELGTENASFAAFYPVLSAEAAAANCWSVATDQRVEGEYERSDLLCARTEGQRGQKVELQFSHFMSRLNIVLRSNGVFSEQEIADAVIRIKSYTKIGFQPDLARIEKVVGEVGNVIAKYIGGGVFQAVLCPQEVLEEWRTKCWLEIEIGGKKLEYKAPAVLSDGSEFARLESGKQLSLNIELKQNVMDWSNQTVWVYGVKNPPVSDWHYVYPLQKILGLKWNADYGWYDCNKLQPNSGGVDSELCWAATVSNMIYWWLDQNNDYVGRYAKYNGPKVYNNSFDCEVFDYFKKHFENTGNDVAASLSWFFNGRFGTSMKDGAAFFKEVFGVGPVARITRFGERSFTEEIKKAFLDKESIACTIKYPSGYLHAVSIWGVDFDGNGEVAAIYIADSNDRDLDEQYEGWQSALGCYQTRAGLIRKAIQIKSDGVFMEGSAPGYFTFKIEELNLLGLMRDKWSEYFSQTKR